jgi:hypothetical protein
MILIMFVLAHLSDPHRPPLPRPSPFELLGKRLGGICGRTARANAKWFRGTRARASSSTNGRILAG